MKNVRLAKNYAKSLRKGWFIAIFFLFRMPKWGEKKIIGWISIYFKIFEYSRLQKKTKQHGNMPDCRRECVQHLTRHLYWLYDCRTVRLYVIFIPIKIWGLLQKQRESIDSTMHHFMGGKHVFFFWNHPISLILRYNLKCFFFYFVPKKQHRFQHGGVWAGVRPATFGAHFLLHAAVKNGSLCQKTCAFTRGCQLDFPQHVSNVHCLCLIRYSIGPFSSSNYASITFTFSYNILRPRSRSNELWET